MSTISLKKGAPAEITIPEIQKRYRISLKTDLAFQRFRTLLSALHHPMIFPPLFHCPKLPSYIAASLAPSSRRSTVQNSSSNIAASLNAPSHQTTAQSYLPTLRQPWPHHLDVPLPKTHLPTLRHPWTRHLTRPPPKATFLCFSITEPIISPFRQLKLSLPRCNISWFFFTLYQRLKTHLIPGSAVPFFDFWAAVRIKFQFFIKFCTVFRFLGEQM